MPGSVSLRFDVKEVIDAHDLLDDMPGCADEPAGARPGAQVRGAPGMVPLLLWLQAEGGREGRTFEDEGVTLHEMVALE